MHSDALNLQFFTSPWGNSPSPDVFHWGKEGISSFFFPQNSSLCSSLPSCYYSSAYLLLFIRLFSLFLITCLTGPSTHLLRISINPAATWALPTSTSSTSQPCKITVTSLHYSFMVNYAGIEVCSSIGGGVFLFMAKRTSLYGLSFYNYTLSHTPKVKY